MTGIWVYAFHTFLFHDQTWEAETELENNRWTAERILQDNKWFGRREEKRIYIPDGQKQLVGYRYSALPWKDGTFCVMVYPEQIVLEIPVTVPDADAIAAKWEKRLGIPPDPVRTRIQLTEEEKKQPIHLPDMGMFPVWEEVFSPETPYSPEDLYAVVSLEAAAEHVPACRKYTVQIRRRKMQLTRRAQNYELAIYIQLGHCVQMHHDTNLFEDNSPIGESEMILQGAGFTADLVTQYGVHTDQQGFEAFLAHKLESAEHYWQILQREGVTAPDLPEWYR